MCVCVCRLCVCVCMSKARDKRLGRKERERRDGKTTMETVSQTLSLWGILHKCATQRLLLFERDCVCVSLCVCCVCVRERREKRKGERTHFSPFLFLSPFCCFFSSSSSPLFPHPLSSSSSFLRVIIGIVAALIFAQMEKERECVF